MDGLIRYLYGSPPELVNMTPDDSDGEDGAKAGKEDDLSLSFVSERTMQEQMKVMQQQIAGMQIALANVEITLTHLCASIPQAQPQQFQPVPPVPTPPTLAPPVSVAIPAGGLPVPPATAPTTAMTPTTPSYQQQHPVPPLDPQPYGLTFQSQFQNLPGQYAASDQQIGQLPASGPRSLLASGYVQPATPVIPPYSGPLSYSCTQLPKRDTGTHTSIPQAHPKQFRSVPPVPTLTVVPPVSSQYPAPGQQIGQLPASGPRGLHASRYDQQATPVIPAYSAVTTTEGPPLDIWDSRNVHEQDVVFDSPYSELLNKYRVTLIENLRLDDMWHYLLYDNVLTVKQMKRFKKNVPSRQVNCLLDHVDACPTWRFHAFLRACARTQQGHLIQKLELDPGTYLTPEAPFLQPQGLYLDFCTQRAIKGHAERCRATLGHRNLFDLADSPAVETYDSSRTYITVTAKHMGDLQTKVPIDTLQILQKFRDVSPPNTVRLYGESGSGKSELLRMLVYDWSTSVLYPSRQTVDTCSGDILWTTMVYLPARDIRSSVEDAIKEHLGCRKEDCDILLDHFHKGNGTALLIDALDEVRNKQILENIERYVCERYKSGGPTVLVSARTDQCNIPSRAFSRNLTLEGFTGSQSISYIEKFFALGDTQQEETLQSVLGYVERNTVQLQPILVNPLRLHIFCALTLKGLLELTEGVILNFIKLFLPLEEFLLKRELRGKTISPEAKKWFYSMALHCLLKGMRSIPQSVFNMYSVDECFHVFMERQHTVTVTACEDILYTFSHEMVYEYFASRGLDTLPEEDKTSLIMSICCEVNLQNVQYLVGQVILNLEGHAQQLFTSLVRCILVLSHVDKNWKSTRQDKSPYDHLKCLQTQVIPPKDLDRLLTHQVETPQSTWKEINNAFSSDSEVLREVGWLSGLPEGTLSHVGRCLRECPDDNMRRAVVEGTVYRLLPADYTKGYGLRTVYPVGGVRWGQVFVGGGRVQVSAWCPQDVCAVLQTHSESHSELQTTRCVYIRTDKYTDTWGPTPHSAFTQEWDTVIQVYNTCVRCDTLCIYVNRTDPLRGLFTCLHKLTTRGQSVTVCNGTVSVCDVLACVHRCNKARVGLQLGYTRIVLPQGQDDVTRRETRHELLSKVNCEGGKVLQCDTEWVTVGGEEFVWSDTDSDTYSDTDTHSDTGRHTHTR